MAFATSRVDAFPPISYVRFLPSAMTRAMAVSRRVAISVSLSQSSISLAVRSMAMGLTLYWPAYFGADPCVNAEALSDQRPATGGFAAQLCVSMSLLPLAPFSVQRFNEFPP